MRSADSKGVRDLLEHYLSCGRKECREADIALCQELLEVVDGFEKTH